MRDYTHDTPSKSHSTPPSQPASHVDGHAAQHGIHHGHGAGHGPESGGHKGNEHAEVGPQGQAHIHQEKKLHHTGSEHDHSHDRPLHGHEINGQPKPGGAEGHDPHAEATQS